MKYSDKIKRKMVLEIIGGIILLPPAIYLLIKYLGTDGVVYGTPFKDFIGGFFNGVRSSIVTGFAAFLIIIGIKDYMALKDPEKLKKKYVDENDERLIALNSISSKTTFNIIYYVILSASVITGLFNAAVSLTLLAVWVFIVAVKFASIAVYSKKM